MTQINSGMFDNKQHQPTMRERLSDYFTYWPLFLICLLVTVGAGIFYARYTLPKYIAATSLLVKGSEGGSAASGDLIETVLNGKREVNLNNEMLLLNATSLMERTVTKNEFNISYFKKGRLLNIDIYKDAPFTLSSKDVTDSIHTYEISVLKMDTAGGEFLYGTEKMQKTYAFKWGTPFIISGRQFTLRRKEGTKLGDEKFIVRWQPVQITAGELLNDLSIKAFDIKTSVIQLTLKTQNPEKGKDVLNALFAEFYLSDIEDRSNLSERTVQFIDDRLLLIAGELKGVEGNLENYQGNNQLVDIKGQSSQQLENANTTLKTIKDLAVQQGVVSIILDYFSNPNNNSKLVPSSLGLNDGTLSSLITQYNELQLKRERETPLVAPNSTVMQDLNTQLSNLKSSILESLNNISKNLRLQEGSFQQQNTQYKNFLSSIPHNERVLQEIKRKQGITEGLYLYLLQKREEAAISSTASKVAHYKQIDLATAKGPVEPNSRNIIMYTALLGLFLAAAIIYIRELLNDKIITAGDITSKVSIPVIGKINHIPKKNKQVLAVMDRSFISEQFRAIRTNVTFLLNQRKEKIILVTSSLSGEGKSFISLNMAAVLAITGKKVALLEFDTRKPTIANNLGLDISKGLTNFLSDKNYILDSLYQQIEEIPSLHIYVSGAITVNPADLLQSENMPKLFESLNSIYDYIIIDSPPASLVSDAFILGRYAEMVLYIVRQGVSAKKQIEFINEVDRNKNLNNLNLILNDQKINNEKDYGKYYG